MTRKTNHLTLYIVIGIVLAIALAIVAPELAAGTQLGGEIFLRLLKMLVVPLVMASVMSGIIGLGDIRRLGRPGAATVGYYLMTTILAVVTGLIVVNLMEPGVGTIPAEKLASIVQRPAESGGSGEAGIGMILHNLALMLFTDNLFEAAVAGKLLPLILFSILFAGLLTTMGRRVETLTTMIVQANEALIQFVMLLMKLAPLGIFCLVAARFGRAQLEGQFLAELQHTGRYVLTVLSGLAVHGMVTIPLLLWLASRRSPLRFVRDMSQALLTAFSTASSSATLPVTIECASEKAGVSKKSVDFVLPLGATVNMDGTALYEAVAAIFIAQVIGLDLSLGQQAIVALTATLAAIGAAGIPEAGLVTMIIVLSSVGLPTEYISLILAVDWLLDRFRTSINVFGDAVGAAIIETFFEAGPSTPDST